MNSIKTHCVHPLTPLFANFLKKISIFYWSCFPYFVLFPLATFFFFACLLACLPLSSALLNVRIDIAELTAANPVNLFVERDRKPRRTTKRVSQKNQQKFMGSSLCIDFETAAKSMPRMLVMNV